MNPPWYHFNGPENRYRIIFFLIRAFRRTRSSFFSLPESMRHTPPRAPHFRSHRCRLTQWRGKPDPRSLKFACRIHGPLFF